MEYHQTSRYAVILILLVPLILSPPLTTSSPAQDEYPVDILSIVNLRLELDESWQQDILLVRYAHHNISSSIYPTDPTITETIVYLSLLSSESSRSISHRGDSIYLEVDFLPLVELHTVELRNNGQLAEVYVNVSIIQTGPPTTPDPYNSGVLTGALLILLTATVVPLMVLALTLLYLRQQRSSV